MVKQFTNKFHFLDFKQNGYYVAGAGKIFITLRVIILHVWDEYQAQVFDDRWNFSGWSTKGIF